MNDKDLEELKRQIHAEVHYQTRWIRRIPMLIGVLGALLALLGLWYPLGPLITIGVATGVTGFCAQAVIWYCLHDAEKL